MEADPRRARRSGAVTARPRSVQPDQEGFHGRSLALQIEEPSLSVRIASGDRSIHRAAAKDVTPSGDRLKPGGGVRDVAERCEILEAAVSHVSHVLLSGADADANLEPAPRRAEAPARVIDLLALRETGATVDGRDLADYEAVVP